MPSIQPLLEKLELSKIEAMLTTRWLGRNVNELWETIDSTNSRAITLAGNGAGHGTMVVTKEQTAGRGRSGRQWFSPAGTGLYMSFLIRPKIEVGSLPVITLVTGVAVVQAIQKCLNIRLGLKWVNDLISDGKKVGGILCEYQNSPTNNTASRALIIGIGLNLHKPRINPPDDLNHKIGFLDSNLPPDQPAIDTNILIAAIANELETSLEQMQAGHLQLLLDQWRAYSITLGEQIIAIVGDKQIAAEALDITDSGELIVKTNSGTITLPAGEVSIRTENGYI